MCINMCLTLKELEKRVLKYAWERMPRGQPISAARGLFFEDGRVRIGCAFTRSFSDFTYCFDGF